MSVRATLSTLDAASYAAWLSLLARGLSLFVTLPLVLAIYPAETVAVWYVFSLAIALHPLAEMGFGGNFSRAIAYAMGGATTIDMADPGKRPRSNEPNLHMLADIVATMRLIYGRIAVISLLILAIPGSFFVAPLIERLEVPEYGWIGWAIVATSFSIRMLGGGAASYMLGVERVAEQKFAEAAAWGVSGVASLLVLWAKLPLHYFVLSVQGPWFAWYLVINWQARTARDGLWARLPPATQQSSMLEELKPRVIRTAVGLFSNYGVTQGSAAVFARVAEPTQAASFLLALRLAQSINMFGAVPFQVRLPQFARLHAAADPSKLMPPVEASIRLAAISTALGMGVLGLFGPIGIRVFESDVSFVSPVVWWVLGLSFLFERIAAMHLQLYSTTNHIVWHIANAGTGAVFLAVSAVTIFLLDDQLGFALGLLCSNAGFFFWYCVRLSRRSFPTDWSFHVRTTIPAFAVFVAFVLAHVLLVSSG